MTRAVRIHGLAALILVPLAAGPAWAQAPVLYTVTYPEPSHRWLQVSATFPEAGTEPLRLQMSRSSPGRYGLHEFAKNLYEVRAYDGKGLDLVPLRTSPHEWSVSGHDGTVRVEYRLYGDRIDGTYVAVDTTHAHMNMPATFMWAHGMENRPVRVRFALPDPTWTVATQLLPTRDPTVFEAPNLQYFMDSPAEVGPLSIRTFVVANPDGSRYEFRTAVHHSGSDADMDDYAAKVEKVVREQQAVFGELPAFDGGVYTFIADYLPYADGDGMEHRNSTILTSSIDFSDAEQRREAIGTVSHEFFHSWNVERIRPAGLEPFDFTRANMSDGLWLAEGFTSYYGPLTLHRAGVTGLDDTIGGFGVMIDAAVNGTGRQFRSAAEMSRLAPLVDGTRALDRTNLQTTFISYYTWGAAIALGLDLSLRVMSDGTITLDDYMRALWRAHGKPGGPVPGLVAKPYTLRDARDRLADVCGSRSFANDFFDHYIEGRDVVNYAALVEQAGLVLRRQHVGAGWIGRFGTESAPDGLRITTLVPPGSPAYGGGLDQDDVILALAGETIASSSRLREVLRRHRPGDQVRVQFLHRGTPGAATLTLVEDPTLELIPMESAGGTPSEAQRAFRQRWLGSRQPPRQP